MYSSSPYNNSSCRISGLSLSWSVAQLGWIAGPVSVVLFALVTYLNASLLTKFHHYSHHRNGVNVTDRSYLEAVRNILGDLNARVCSLLVFFNLFKLGVVYTITSASSISDTIVKLLPRTLARSSL
ncbi:putative amino acid transporter, transmembrane domain-containing protein [Helianthus annuus]|nr:putative amino acid transporter, transmembrane domain-containing protein [Helianthus annuus]